MEKKSSTEEKFRGGVLPLYGDGQVEREQGGVDHLDQAYCEARSDPQDYQAVIIFLDSILLNEDGHREIVHGEGGHLDQDFVKYRLNIQDRKLFQVKLLQNIASQR